MSLSPVRVEEIILINDLILVMCVHADALSLQWGAKISDNKRVS
jgi:hypothetical protein